ncbi:tetratricopeptide repeat protein [Aquimarina sp. U1-2]|uniref:tetratricopeptide repeat protein n=1 Tax=Aquimarina sp. U1-2 TaxID=2823141 RepID=UPI001AECE83E|nr:tetratricopeptide repeat protein [Aquimarina sp. U1-2]MBP2831167.1 tetratricopeptide repeat protein [Aquimarina sp. U1-2]
MKAIPFLSFLTVSISYCQLPNCNLFLSKKDTLQYNACKFLEKNEHKYYQFDKRYHDIFDEALKICPFFAYAYRERAAPYIKSGNFLVWKQNMDKAVKYNPVVYLPVRASLRYKFFADYKGALKDIDSLSTIISHDIGYSSNGTYHLNIVKGLCLKALDRIDEAIEIITKQSEIEGDFSMYNHLHLGVLYIEKKDYHKALTCFEKQYRVNNIAENHYYSAICYKNLNNLNMALAKLNEALILYKSKNKMIDPYNELFDQIYLSDINREIDLIKKRINN